MIGYYRSVFKVILAYYHTPNTAGLDSLTDLTNHWWFVTPLWESIQVASFSWLLADFFECLEDSHLIIENMHLTAQSFANCLHGFGQAFVPPQSFSDFNVHTIHTEISFKM